MTVAKPVRQSLAVATAMLASVPAFAHTGLGEAGGLLQGFVHPVAGLDHVLAMVLVGLLAWQLGGRALWLVPVTFVLVMAVGGALGVAGIEVPFVEAGIALSVVVFGGLVAFGARSPVAVAAGLVGLFAVFHGYAHGSEMPDGVGGMAYAGGFMAATALLHAGGIALGFLVGKAGGLAVRSAGGAAAAAGLGLLAGTL